VSWENLAGGISVVVPQLEFAPHGMSVWHRWNEWLGTWEVLDKEIPWEWDSPVIQPPAPTFTLELVNSCGEAPEEIKFKMADWSGSFVPEEGEDADSLNISLVDSQLEFASDAAKPETTISIRMGSLEEDDLVSARFVSLRGSFYRRIRRIKAGNGERCTCFEPNEEDEVECEGYDEY